MSRMTRRRFLHTSVAAAAAFSDVPDQPVGGPQQPRIVATAEGSADLGRARRRRRLAGLLTVAAVAVASALAAAGFLRALSRTSADLRDPDGTHATLVALDDEAERLVRSAIVASHRGARP